MVSARNLAFNLAATVTTSTLTVVGLNFVFEDTTPSARLDAGACSTVAWTSSTTSFCYAAVVNPLVVTVGAVVGTMTLSFTYDGRDPFVAVLGLLGGDPSDHPQRRW